MDIECSVLDSRVNARPSNVERQFGLSVTRPNLNLYLTSKVPTRYIYKATRMMYRVSMVTADKDVIEVYECTMLPSSHWSSHLDGIHHFSLFVQLRASHIVRQACFIIEKLAALTSAVGNASTIIRYLVKSFFTASVSQPWWLRNQYSVHYRRW